MERKKFKKMGEKLQKLNRHGIFATDDKVITHTFFAFARSGHAWDTLPGKHQSANGNRRSQPSEYVGHRALKLPQTSSRPEAQAGRLQAQTKMEHIDSLTCKSELLVWEEFVYKGVGIH